MISDSPFGHVEGHALGLGQAGEEEDDEAEGLEEDAPLGQEAEQEPALEIDDPRQAERGEDHDQADERKAQGDLVGDELGRAAEAAEQGEAVARGPAAEEDAVDAEGEHGQDEEEAGVEVDDLERDRPAEEADGRRRRARRPWSRRRKRRRGTGPA